LVYRAPAENDEAKRDDAEVRAFADRLRAQRARVWLLTGAIALVSVGAFAFVLWLGMVVAAPPPPPSPNCHEILVFVPGEDGKMLSERRIDCAPPGAPAP
jgi:hypothetical protein